MALGLVNQPPHFTLLLHRTALSLDVHNPRTNFLIGIRIMDWLSSIAIVGLTIMVLIGLDLGGVASPQNPQPAHRRRRTHNALHTLGSQRRTSPRPAPPPPPHPLCLFHRQLRQRRQLVLPNPLLPIRARRHPAHSGLSIGVHYGWRSGVPERDAGPRCGGRARAAGGAGGEVRGHECGAGWGAGAAAEGGREVGVCAEFAEYVGYVYGRGGVGVGVGVGCEGVHHGEDAERDACGSGDGSDSC